MTFDPFIVVRSDFNFECHLDDIHYIVIVLNITGLQKKRSLACDFTRKLVGRNFATAAPFP